AYERVDTVSFPTSRCVTIQQCCRSLANTSPPLPPTGSSTHYSPRRRLVRIPYLLWSHPSQSPRLRSLASLRTAFGGCQLSGLVYRQEVLVQVPSRTLLAVAAYSSVRPTVL